MYTAAEHKRMHPGSTSPHVSYATAAHIGDTTIEHLKKKRTMGEQ